MAQFSNYSALTRCVTLRYSTETGDAVVGGGMKVQYSLLPYSTKYIDINIDINIDIDAGSGLPRGEQNLTRPSLVSTHCSIKIGSPLLKASGNASGLPVTSVTVPQTYCKS